MRQLFKGLPTFAKVFICILMVFWVSIVIGVVGTAYNVLWAVFHPDAVGHYVGTVVNGFQQGAAGK